MKTGVVSLSVCWCFSLTTRGVFTTERTDPMIADSVEYQLTTVRTAKSEDADSA